MILKHTLDNSRKELFIRCTKHSERNKTKSCHTLATTTSTCQRTKHVVAAQIGYTEHGILIGAQDLRVIPSPPIFFSPLV